MSWNMEDEAHSEMWARLPEYAGPGDIGENKTHDPDLIECLGCFNYVKRKEVQDNIAEHERQWCDECLERNDELPF